MTATNQLTQEHNADALDGVWSAVGGLAGLGVDSDPGFFIEGSGALAGDGDIETAGLRYTPATNINLTGQKNIWVWMMSVVPAFLDIWANGGLRIELIDGSANSSTWYVGGKDTYSGGWRRFVINTDTTPDEISGTVDLTDIDSITMYFKGLIKSRLSDNCYVDSLEFGDLDEGGQFDGGTTGTPLTWQDLVDDDAALTTPIGMIRKSEGVYIINGPITWGDVTSGDAIFTDLLQSVRTENWYRTFTTGNRGSAESLVSTEHFKLTVVNSSGADCRFIVGSKSGTRGINGGSFVQGGTDQNLYIVATDTNVDYFQIYGWTAEGLGTVLCPVASANKEMIDVTMISCGVFKPDTMSADFINFINSPGIAVEISTTSHDLKDVSFINCVTDVQYTTTGSFGMVNWLHNSSTNDTDNANEASQLTIASVGGTDHKIGDGTIVAAGQSFLGTATVLSRIIFRLRAVSSPTGNAVCKLYASTGSDPTRTPTGSAVATSNLVVVSGFGAYADVDFEFEDEFTMSAVNYFAVIEYVGDVTNHIEVDANATGATYASNNFASNTGSWAAIDDDADFSINTGGIITVNASGTSNPSGTKELFSSTLDGATITIAAKNLEFTGLPVNTEVRAYTGSVTDVENAVEIGGVEDSSTSFNFDHQSGGVAGFVNFIQNTYEPFTLKLTYSTSDQSIPITLSIDRTYENPA